MKLQVVHTIGVYGRTGKLFIDDLRKHRIDLLVNVRRRRGVRGSEYAWSNSLRLQALLKKEGIAYLHAKDWTPTEEIIAAQHEYDLKQFGGVRKREHLAPGFEKGYMKLLKEHPVSELLNLIQEQFGTATSICLLCVEAEANLCHRKLLAEALSKHLRSDAKHL